MFEGSVYAGSILSGESQSGINYGYLPGSGVSASANFGSEYFTSGINQGPLAYANNYNAATKNNTTTYPEYFKADKITAVSSVYSPSVKYAVSGESDVELVRHYHTITVLNGKVTIGAPANPAQAPSFDINDLISSITPVFGA